MEFRILGPLEIVDGPERLDLGGPRQQIAVAAFLLSANRLVTMDRLLEAIYGEELPPTCRSQAQISVSLLRRMFAAHSDTPVISTHPQGYVMQVADGELDAQRFEELVAAGRAARDELQLKEAVAKYRDGLRLWRGDALTGIDSQLIRAAAGRLDEERITVNEDRIKLELDLGRHYELVGELYELVDQYPLRERLRGQLMLALYRCGRTAEALSVYRDTRQVLISELGLEPGERLQQLEHAILTSDSSLDPPPETINLLQPVSGRAPNMLTTDIADFTGRTDQIEQISRHVIGSAEEGAARLAIPIVVIIGKGGVGKTSLAVHGAHAVAGLFPGGQLFADLHGGSSHPVSPMQVLERFLRALGVPSAQIPDGLDERAEAYRSLLADRKVLVVLDDATSETQVTPLLPGGGLAAVIITSRGRLAGLAGAAHIELDIFDADKSLDLLERIVGTERVQSQRQAAQALAGHCGHLPLALRIAGARLSAHPHWSVQQLADRLADETHRLDELKHGDTAIRRSMWLSYESATEDARRLFRRLALLDMPAFSRWLTAPLLDQPLADAEDLLDELVTTQLVETTGTRVGIYCQYNLHELIRLFARERLADEEPPAQRKAALERALGALLYLAERAHSRYYGGDYVRVPSVDVSSPMPEQRVELLVRDPLAWYERERGGLISGVRQAAQAGLVDLCWSLAFSAVTLFESRAYLDDWEETHAIALEATRKARNRRGQATMLYSIASLDMERQRFDAARQGFTEARQLFQDIGDEQGIGLVTRHLAYIDLLSGEFAEASRRYQEALTIFERTGDHVASAYVLQNLAQVKLEVNEIDDAKELLSDALRLSRSVRCARVETQVLHRIGEAHLLAGELTRAIEVFNDALAGIREVGDPIGEAYVLQGIGVARVRLGEFGQARKVLQLAMRLAEMAGERMARARALLGLSELAAVSGNPEQAGAAAREASESFHAMGAPSYQVRALTLLSQAQADLGDAVAAEATAAEAAAVSSKLAGNLPAPLVDVFPGRPIHAAGAAGSGSALMPFVFPCWAPGARQPAAVAHAAWGRGQRVVAQGGKRAQAGCPARLAARPGALGRRNA